MDEKNKPGENLPIQPEPAAPAPAPKKTEIVLRAEFGDVYVRVVGNEIMRPIRANMTLFEKMGHFYGLPAKRVKDDRNQWVNETSYAITSAGYTHLNKTAGISILSPSYVIVDGVKQFNPHIERDAKTRGIRSVAIRKMGIGFAPSGSIVVIDKTLFYNTYTYFIQSVQAKMKKKKWYDKKDEDPEAQDEKAKKDEKANPNAAMIGQENENPASMKPAHPGRWAFFPTEPPLGIWVNYDDPAILDCLDEHTQRQRFGDRIAQSIVERNILKDHPSIGVSKIEAKTAAGKTGKISTVTVYGYRHDFNPTQLASLMRQAEESAETAPFEVRSGVVEGQDLEEEKAVIDNIREAGDEPERGPAAEGEKS